MRIKRIFALLVCIVIACASLVSCSEEIGDYLDGYGYEPEITVDLYYDFYIIVGDNTDDMAKTTVNDKMNQILSDKYRTKINMHFLSESEYVEAVKADIADATVPTVPRNYYYGGKILLITGTEMLADIQDKLVDLKPYLDSNDYSFGTLKSQIAGSLMSAAAYTYTKDGAEVTATLGIPNNHIVGEYEYVLINRDIAVKELSYSDAKETSELRQITSLDSDDALELIAAAEAKGYTADQLIKTVKGPYEMKGAIESDKTNGDWLCNVSKYPIATLESAYASAFGVIPTDNIVVDGKVVSDNIARAMDVIYGINTDVELRNTLQYGVQNTNFSLNSEGYAIPLTSEGSNYNMNLRYTGDAFNAYYREGVWTPDMKNNGKKQNLESVYE